MPHKSSSFLLKRPCSNCPFRSDVEFYLHPERVEEIIDSIRVGQSFYCHKTTVHDEEEDEFLPSHGEQHCVGSMLLLENEESPPGQMERIAARLGLYDPSKLDRSLPIYDSGEEMIEAFEARAEEKA
jgi:hypothetical protein